MFSMSAHVTEQYRSYLKAFPNEARNLDLLGRQIEGDVQNIFDRKNMRGHVTTSALVYDPTLDMILTIWHLLLERTLQPGGHHEGVCALSESADREAVEETGHKGALLHPWHAATGAPLDIDTHEIPPQPRKNEGLHMHHDFIYLFTGDATKPLRPQLNEVARAGWTPRKKFGELLGYRMPRMVQKLNAIYGLS